jgi:hypothetical protein
MVRITLGQFQPWITLGQFQPCISHYNHYFSTLLLLCTVGYSISTLRSLLYRCPNCRRLIWCGPSHLDMTYYSDLSLPKPENETNKRTNTFMFVPCVNSIKALLLFHIDAHSHKITGILKQLKIPTVAPTCFGSRRNHYQGAIFVLS